MNTRSVKQAGFSLIELMIVVVIVGILTAVAVPSYRNYVTRTHRAAARACMLEITQFMERAYTTSMSYAGAVLPVNGGCHNDDNLKDRYTITLGSLAQNTYTVTATPKGTQLAADTACGTLTLDQTGHRGESGTSDAATCWGR